MSALGRRQKRALGAWLAIFALALNALWPLLAQAKPRSATLVPVCTVGGETHYVELDAGTAPAQPSHSEHCALCPLGADRPGLVGQGDVPVVSDTPDFTQARLSFSGKTREFSSARSRAPPAVP